MWLDCFLRYLLRPCMMPIVLNNDCFHSRAAHINILKYSRSSQVMLKVNLL